MPLTAVAMRALMRQLQEVKAQPVADVQLQRSDDLGEVRFELDGPEGTPFAHGRFLVALAFDEEYPAVPPRGVFHTRIFHPNVSARGEVCVNALKRDWHSELGLRHILLVIRCLLIEPNPESALNEEAGRLLLEDYDAYARKAAMLTDVYARRPDTVARFGAGAAAAVVTPACDGGSSSSSSSTHRAAAVHLSSSSSSSDEAAAAAAAGQEGGVCGGGRNTDNSVNDGNVAAATLGKPTTRMTTTTAAEKRRHNALRRI